MDAEVHRSLLRIYELLKCEQADELLINGSRGTFLTAGQRSWQVPDVFSDAGVAGDFARELAWQAGRRLDPLHAATGGSVDDLGLRWHAVINPIAHDEIIVSIRRHRFEEIGLDQFTMGDGCSEQILEACQKNRPLLIAGMTGAGKTTLLVALLKKFFLEKRVVILESIPEIPPLASRWLRLTEAPPQVSGKGGATMQQIARESLRLRPDVLVVGELRGDEAEIFFDMSQSGHGGCLATIHADSPRTAISRIARMAPKTVCSLSADFMITVVAMARQSNRVIVSAVETLAIL